MKKSEYIPTLKELFDANVDVRISYIPDEWKANILKYATERNGKHMNSTCLYGYDFGEKGDDRFMFSYEYKRWYLLNEVVIKRETKIESLLK